jgi:hypothetical protein
MKSLEVVDIGLLCLGICSFQVYCVPLYFTIIFKYWGFTFYVFNNFWDVLFQILEN